MTVLENLLVAQHNAMMPNIATGLLAVFGLGPHHRSEAAAIERARQILWERARVLTEPGGAAAYAALDSGAYTPPPGERIAVLVSGGNTTVTF